MNEVAIKVQNLTKIYPLYNKPVDRMKEALHPFRKIYHHDFYALKDVSFEIKKGETVGIIGKNGAGKSTLLKILTGVLTPSSGSTQINGRVSSLLELGTGFNPELTGIENIYLNGIVNGIKKKEMDSRVDDIIAFADIGEFINQPLKTYSSGMFVRLAFACATAIEPDILIIDEALAVGDIHFQLKCMDKMKSFKDTCVTIIYVTHDITSVKHFCDKVIWLMNSQIHMKGDSVLVTEY
ncbi:MAG: ABC transporter ATP-binding protein, partial [Lentisphaerota bacterium]